MSNYHGCHKIEFNYLARGPNLGTLAIVYQEMGVSGEKIAWTFDGQETAGWSQETITIDSQYTIQITVSIFKTVLCTNRYNQGVIDLN